MGERVRWGSVIMGDARYSFSLTTFSPSGKLVQIEYALKAVSGGHTALGIKAKNGVVIATEKKLPELVLSESVSKIHNVTDSIGMVYAGIGPDSGGTAGARGSEHNAGVHPVRGSATVRSVSTGGWLRRLRPALVSGRSVWFVLGMEGECDRVECYECKDVFGKAVPG